MSPAALVRIFTVVLAVAIAVVVWRRRPQPGATPFALMMAAAGWWAFFALLEHAAVEPATKLRYAALEYPGIVALAPLWFVFGVAYGGHASRLTPRRVLALAVVPVLTVLLAWTNASHHLVWTSLAPSSPAPGAPLVYGHGAWFWVTVAYSYALLVAGCVVLLVSLTRADGRAHRPTAPLLAGMALPWIANALYLTRASALGGIDPTPLAFALTGVVYAVGVFKGRLFDLVPVARHAVIDGMADGVLVMDRQDRVVDVNPAARTLLGLDEPIVGEPAARVLARWPALAAAAGAGEATEADARVDTERGARDLHLRVSRILDGRGRPRGRLLVMTDVTERKRTEEALRESEKLASLGQLLAGVAHELNNPLSVVIGHATLLRREMAPGPAVARIEKIATAADRCARIVSNFVAVARRRQPHRVATDLNRVLREAIGLLADDLHADDIRVSVDLAPDLPAVGADADQLHQVVVNLVANARHAMRAQPQPRRLTVTSRLHAGRGRVSFSIADTGAGIPPELRSRVFEPFFTTKPVGMGSGLGLSVCRGIVEAHEGSIELADGPDGGAVVVVELPVGLGEPATADAEPADVGAPGKRILVVEDEPLVADLLVELLTADGHRVDVAGDGRQALDRLAATEFDVIISDVKMPVLDGAGFYQRLALREPRLRDRVVFITGDTLTAETRRFLARTGAPTLDKPFDAAQVRRVVQRVLRRP